MTLDLRQLRHLLALAEYGSVGRAAAALGLTQPALSRSLQVLEHQVGVALFGRSRSGIAPTDEGRLLIQRARELVYVADELDREVRRNRTSGAGQVVVGAGPYPAETILPAALARFATASPLVRVRVLVRDWDELLRRLRARDVDFFVGETSTLKGEHDLDVEPLERHPVFFVARRGHPLVRRGRGARAAQTFAYPFVAMSRFPPRTLQPMLALRREDSARPGCPFPAIELSTLAAVKRVTASSDAIAPLTLPCIAEEVEKGTLVPLGTEPWLFLSYGVVTLKGQRLSAWASALRESLRAAEAALVRKEALLVARHCAPARASTRKR